MKFLNLLTLASTVTTCIFITLGIVNTKATIREISQTVAKQQVEIRSIQQKIDRLESRQRSLGDRLDSDEINIATGLKNLSEANGNNTQSIPSLMDGLRVITRLEPIHNYK